MKKKCGKINVAVTGRMPGMNDLFFCSWSGGKDSCLALHRARKTGAEPVCLLTVIGEDGRRSKAHGLRREVLEAQASALEIPLFMRCASWDEYEPVFVEALRKISAQGVGWGVFGDIDFPPHLEWEEKTCAKAGMLSCVPLWGMDREDLVDEFLSLGYKALIVTVNEKKLDRKFLGRMISRELVDELRKAGVDPCGESGEYHTLVVDGPVFSKPLPVKAGSILEHAGYCMLDVRLQTPDDMP